MSLLTKATGLKTLDATVGWLLCKALGWLRHVLRRQTLADDPSPSARRRILFIRPGGMGDMLMLLPVLRHVSEHLPSAEVDIVCERRNVEVLRLAGIRDRAYLYDAEPLRLLCRLHRTAYDVVIDTEQFHNFSAILSWLSGAPVRIGFKINPARLHLYTHLIGYDVDGYELDQFKRLLGPLGLKGEGLRLDGALPRSAPDALPDELARLAAGGGIISLCAGASDVYRRWDPKRFSELIDRLTTAGFAVALVGDAGDRPAALSLLSGLDSRERVGSFVGALSLQETAAVIGASSVFVGCDSGLAHLATALGIPTVVLFGPSDPNKWSSPSEQHAVIHRALPCSPCAIFGYRKWCREIPCMQSITVGMVFAAVEACQAEG